MSVDGCIHQLVHTLSYGDAISGEVLALKRCFQSLGYQSEIFALNVHPKLKGEAKKYGEFPSDYSGRVILHYSLGSPLNDLYRRLTRARRALIFHNLTPSDWFVGINPRIVHDIEAGVEELPQLCAITDELIADSAFNAAELAGLGFEATVLELPIDPVRWSIASNAGIAEVVKSDPSLHLLHVGRLAPNKCIEDIIKIFYFLHHYLNPHSRLWIVGIDIDTEVYSFGLKRLVYELSLEGAVNFVSTFVDAELKALYENASVYLCMSEHEGFCMPVVEAMHFGVPVLAYASSALPDTVANGGILCYEKRPAELAALVQQMGCDPVLRERLIKAGKARVEQLTLEHFSEKVKEIFKQRPSETTAQSVHVG